MQTDYRDKLWGEVFFYGKNILKRDKFNLLLINKSVKNAIVQREFDYANHVVSSYLNVVGISELIELQDEYQLDKIENCQNLFEVEAELLMKVADISVVIQNECDDDFIRNIRSNSCIDIFPNVFRDAVSKLRTSEEIEFQIQTATETIKKSDNRSLYGYLVVINSLLVKGRFLRAYDLLKAQDLEPITEKIIPFFRVFTQINASFLNGTQRRKVIRRVFQKALKNNDWKTVKTMSEVLSMRARHSGFNPTIHTHKEAIDSHIYRLKNESVMAGNVDMVITLNKVLHGEEGSVDTQAVELAACKNLDLNYSREILSCIQQNELDLALKKVAFITDATLKVEVLSKIYNAIEVYVCGKNFDCTDVAKAVNLISHLSKGNVRCLCLNQIALKVFPGKDVMSALYAADEIENLDEFRSVLIKFFAGEPVKLDYAVPKKEEYYARDYYQDHLDTETEYCLDDSGDASIEYVLDEDGEYLLDDDGEYVVLQDL